MSIEHLVDMANDIGHFFASEPQRADAVEGIAGHIQKFWDPRMLRHIVTHLKNGGDGLDELPREAIARLKAPGDWGHGATYPIAARSSA